MSKQVLLIVVTEVLLSQWVAEVEVPEELQAELNIRPTRILGRSSRSEKDAVEDLVAQLVANRIITFLY